MRLILKWKNSAKIDTIEAKHMTELMQCLFQQSALGKQQFLSLSQSVNSLFLAYALIALVTKEVAYLVAFFIACLVIGIGYLAEYQAYLVDLIIYSYIYFYSPKYKTKFACVIIMLLDLGMTMDAVLYATTETYLYSNIEHLALLSHLFLIYTIFPTTRINRILGDFFSSIRNFQSIDYFFIAYWYNVQQIPQTTSKKWQI